MTHNDSVSSYLSGSVLGYRRTRCRCTFYTSTRTPRSCSQTWRLSSGEDEPTLPSTERVWRLSDRLSEPEMDAVIASYKEQVSVISPADMTSL
jgi:hypothetical protein